MNHSLFAALCWLSCSASLLPAQTRPLPASVYTILVKVKDNKGGPVQDATEQLLGAGKGLAKYGRVPGQDPRALAPKDFAGDFARITDLPAGDFVLMVDSPLYARSLSKPFTLPANAEVEVVVVLAVGGVLEGCVLGPDKKPVAGAVVRTTNGDSMRTGPMAAMLATVLVDTLTATSATTGDDGSFRLEHLAAGKYRLVVDHAEFVREELDAEVGGDAVKKLPPIHLGDGVLVTGRVMRANKPVPGAEVTFQFEDVAAIKDPMQAMKVKFYKATADDKGDFRLPVRVPVGKGYVLMAAEPGAPLQQATQFNASRRKFDVRAGGREQSELLLLPQQ
jgi:uncharacterized GH25 family protein